MLALLPPVIGSANGDTPPRKDAPTPAPSGWRAWFMKDHPIRLWYTLYWLLLLSVSSAWFLYLYLT